MKKLLAIILLILLARACFGGEQYAARGNGVLAWIDLNNGKVTGSVNIEPPCDYVTLDYAVYDADDQLLREYREYGDKNWTFEQKVPKRAEKLKLHFVRNEVIHQDTLRYITFNSDTE